MKIFAMILLLCSTTILAAVEQGDDPTDLHSPMVLTGPFPLVSPESWGTYGTFGNTKYTDQSIYSDFYRYKCDGLAIKQLRFRGAPDGDLLRIHMKGKIDAKLAGHDKRYRLKIELLNEGNSVYTTEDNGKVEAKDSDSFDFSFAVPRALLMAEPETTIKITMRTQDY